ncbi:MAG: nucleotidyltransferase [Sedimenticola sp.]
MTVDVGQYSKFLEQFASDIDIPPGKYQDAVERYQAVGRHLEQGIYPSCTGEVKIYPQGSFRLGTVIRPIRGGVEASYDIDLVCEFPLFKSQTHPQVVKSMAGDRLKDHGTYQRMLEPEGRRCWTLEYAEQDGVGFHLDVLPAASDARGLLSTALAITHKEGSAYSWRASNPKGYGAWFDGKNRAAFAFSAVAQKRKIQLGASDVYASIDDVPDQLVRTPLQRAVQIMKRHRDIHFNDSERVKYAPISIIITTLAAHLYENEPDVYSALSGIVGKLRGHGALVEGKGIDLSLANLGLIRRLGDGTWYIGNPVNPDENFADKWHKDNHARARAFFHWLEALQNDLVNILGEPDLQTQKSTLGRTLGIASSAKVFGLIFPAVASSESPPHVHIASAPKPWKAV